MDIRAPGPENTSELTALLKAIRLAGSEEKLGNLIGLSQPAINRAKARGRASPQMARSIHDAFKHIKTPELRVTDHELRPDLYPVPAKQTEAA